MAKRERISEEQLPNFLSKIPDWQRSGNMITRIFELPNFLSAMGFLNSVAICAEVADHHPDMLLFSWNKVKISIATHDKGGLTELDFELAGKINGLVKN